MNQEVEYSHNIQLSEIYKKRALVVNQTEVLQMKCVHAKGNATFESGKKHYLFIAFLNEQYRF